MKVLLSWMQEFADFQQSPEVLGDHLSDLGLSVEEMLQLQDDVLFDLEVNPNRPDAMSVMGVARDLAARLGVPFAVPSPQVMADSHVGAATSSDVGNLDEPVSITILEPDFCRHFTVKVMTDVKVQQSPAWLARRLLALGMRPVNSLVDISNFVMLELGQPSHAFDLDKIADNALSVRMARDGEELVTLDGTARKLSAEDGVIVGSQDEVLSLAGVMGGKSTEISETTTTALIEAAWWDPMTISRTSRRHGLRSEASARFERGVDPEIAELSLLRFAELAQQIGAGNMLSGTIVAEGNVARSQPVRVRTDRVNAILGTDISPGEMKQHLEPMGFGVEEDGAEADGSQGEVAGSQATGSQAAEVEAQALSVSIPSWRPDCETEIDIIEEVGRSYGFSKIQKEVPLFSQLGGLSQRQQLRRKVADLLVGMGLSEAVSLPFLSPDDLLEDSRETAIAVANPMVQEESVMRQSLREGMLKLAAYNHARRIADVAIFEIGNVFSAGFSEEFAGGEAVAAGEAATQELPQEQTHLGVLLSGAEAKEAVKIWLQLCQALGIRDASVSNSKIPGLHPTRAGCICVGQTQFGIVGEIDPLVLDETDLAAPIAFLELNLEAILDQQADQSAAPYSAPTKFPSSDIDLAFVVPEEMPAQELGEIIKRAGGEYLAEVVLFDIFRSDQLETGTRSLAFRLRFEAPDRTLTDKEVATARQQCIKAAQNAGATIRE